MKKNVFGRQLGRSRKARRALFRSLIRELAHHGSITTTKAKAKAVQGDFDKMVGLAKEGSVASTRRIYSYMGNDRTNLERLVELASSLKDRNSGYTRAVKQPLRRGDAAETVKLEVIFDKKPKEKKEKEKEKAKPTKKPAKK